MLLYKFLGMEIPVFSYGISIMNLDQSISNFKRLSSNYLETLHVQVKAINN